MSEADDALRVLAICNPLTLSFRLGALLDVPDYSLTSVANMDDAGKMTEESAFDLILLEIPTVGRAPADFLKSLRWSGSPCQRAIIIVVSGPDHLDEAEELLDAGVSRVLNPGAPEHVLRLALQEAIKIDERYPVSAFVRIPGDELGLNGPVMTQTLDMSASGMMVRLTKDVLIGARFSFTLTLPGVSGAIEGKADVIRLRVVGMDRVQGFAATFAEFSGDGQKRLENFITKQDLR